MMAPTEGTNGTNGTNGTESIPGDDALSRLSHKMALATLRGVYEALRCPGCGEYLYPPVSVCAGGHSLCVECCVEGLCPRARCRRPVLRLRNCALEDAARAALVPCAHRAAGCDLVLPPGDARPHARRCLMRPFRCPKQNPSCHWSGPVQNLSDHIQEHHPLHVGRGPEVELQVGGPLGTRENFGVFLCCGDRFLARVYLRASKRELLAAVLYLGSRRPAKDYAYDASLQLIGEHTMMKESNGRWGKRRIGQRFSVLDAERDLDNVFDASDCFCVPIEDAGYKLNDAMVVRIRIEENA